MTKENGGPAFPLGHSSGMSLRDYFAAKAMQSMINNKDYLDTPAPAIALDAYYLADAMLKARPE